MVYHKKYQAFLFNSILISVTCMTCKDVMELPDYTVLSIDDLMEIKPKDTVECLKYLGRRKINIAEAELIWYNVIDFHNGLSCIPDDVLSLLNWITIAITPDDYANITFNDIDVIRNFGVNYDLSCAQLNAIADRVRDDFSGKQPEDYTYYDLVALNQILCAFNKSEIDRIHPKAYKEAAKIIGLLKNCDYNVIKGFSRLAVHNTAFGPYKKWSQETKEELGIVAKFISEEQNNNNNNNNNNNK